MTAKVSEKLKCVLLDAMIIIEAHELGIWDSLLRKVEVLIPSTIIHAEAFYFHSKTSRRRKAILLNEAVVSGLVTEVTASAADILAVQKLFDVSTLGGLDSGEFEALALINTARMKGALFCTAEKAAIRALALMGYAEAGISLEKLLTQIGLQQKLDSQFTEDFFKHFLKKGKQDRVTGSGLRKPGI